MVLYRPDGLSARVTELGEHLLDILEEESDSSIHTFHRPHDYPITHNFRCEDSAAICTDYIVSFTVDHGRLAVSQLTLTSFHTPNSILNSHSLPILIAFAHSDNITGDARFFKVSDLRFCCLFTGVDTWFSD